MERDFKGWFWSTSYGNKKGKGIVRTGAKKERYYQNKPRFNGVYSWNNLPKTIKDGTYVINLDEYADVGTHWIALFCNKSEIVYFDSFGVEHVPEEINEFGRNKNIIATIFWVQANNSVMYGYFCIGFINFMLAGEKLTDSTSMFSPHDFEKNDHIILSHFKDKWNWQNKIVRTEKIQIKWNKQDWKLF